MAPILYVAYSIMCTYTGSKRYLPTLVEEEEDEEKAEQGKVQMNNYVIPADILFAATLNVDLLLCGYFTPPQSAV